MTDLPVTLDPAEIALTRAALRPYIRETFSADRDDIAALPGTPLNFKFELFQVSGTFKARGAFANLLALDDAGRRAGVTAISAGNHAIAVACAAQRLCISAKVVMVKTASPARVALARGFGAEVLLAEDGATGFAMIRDIERDEGRRFVHPFSTPHTLRGTATLGAEWAEQAGSLDAVILPIGGGGLAAGVATALKQAMPDVAIYGVEPEGADVMARSFAAGTTLKMGPMHSIADSLMAPHTEVDSFALCRANIDALVTVSDSQMRDAMRLLFAELKLAVEPACAAATAAALGPLRERIAGRRTGILLCGTNTDAATFAAHLSGA